MIRKRILAISGSTKPRSTNDIFIRHIAMSAADALDIELFDIGSLPYFIPGVDAPEIVQEFYKNIQSADGILIATPEYVFSLPGILKNAIEWAVATTVFNEKPVAFVVASASGQKAFESLDLILQTLGAFIPENGKLLVSGAKGKTNTANVIDPVTAEHLNALAQALILAVSK